jgi:methionyl-tRNA formyltransferase
MRIVFMGTPAFATASLEALIDAGEDIVAVVTAPDKEAGRGRKIRQSDVKQFALSRKLQILQPRNLKSDEFLSELRKLKPNLIVVVAFRMLPKKVWEIPEYGTINLHASLLPQYRGAAPINWAIINGEKETGVTTFFINQNIDTGDLIMQESITIGENDNAGTLHDRLMKLGAGVLVDTVKAIANGEAPGIPQEDEIELKSAPKIFKEDTRIKWDQSAQEVHNFIRGLSPYPSASCCIEDKDGKTNLKVFEARPGERCGEGKAGVIRLDDKKHIYVACSDRWIELREIQPAGKRRMLVSDYLNGTSLSEEAIMT